MVFNFPSPSSSSDDFLDRDGGSDNNSDRGELNSSKMVFNLTTDSVSDTRDDDSDDNILDGGASNNIMFSLVSWLFGNSNFRRNGRELFQQRKVRIFSKLELANATKNYDYRNKLNDDRFSPVHRGTIAGDTVAVVKKLKDVDKSLLNTEFQSELEILINIRCKSVVKLKGICLKTRIPTLVYEYIPNGTLFQHIHQKTSTILKSWEDRFRIAAEVALALNHMHSQAESPIIHGNIKSANILLDQNNSVKISDFGTSVLISPEHRHIVATRKKDSLSYIDPEYLINQMLTIQSDVYSFGVVLVELLTRKKPNATEPKNPIPIIHRFITSVREMRLVDFEGTTSSAKGDTCESLADFEDTTSSAKGDTCESLANFEDTTSSVKRDTGDPLSDVIDFEDASPIEKERVQRVAKIAERCLEQSGANRPPMSEVAQQLADITTVEGENEDPPRRHRCCRKSLLPCQADPNGDIKLAFLSERIMILKANGMQENCPAMPR
ncbi:hypothetical protein BT93_B1366 [Corymbia citriodora subsp. variegata]|nr:hypothetical protein BT93_B1366 [Corymbia citriodora subsp. variegata]